MTTFTIDAENSITAFGTKQEAEGAQGESFSTQRELADLAASWPANRLAEVWNGIPGLTQVKKFTDRKSALSRIWKATRAESNSGASVLHPTVPSAKKTPVTGELTAIRSGSNRSNATSEGLHIGGP